MKLLFLGCEQDFLDVESRMQAQVAAVQADPRQSVILACSYRPTITLGLQSDFDSEVRVDQKTLNARKIECVRVKRGGKATFQGPGQLALYPIVHLPTLAWSVRAYVSNLVAATQAALQEILPADPDFTGPNDGVWLNAKKVGFIGVRVQHGVTSYGLNLNICDDGGFALINPCGHQGINTIHLETLTTEKVQIESLAEGWAKAFSNFLALGDI